MNSITNPRREILARSPLNKDFRWTQRDLAVCNGIADFGGVLKTPQIAALWWPPSISKKLENWNIDEDQIKALLEQYSASYLDEKIELLKWLLKVEKQSPMVFAALEPALKNVVEVSPEVWLINAIQQDIKPPEAFLSRPKLASQWVSRSCTSRLRLLYDAGYLEREEQATKLSEGRAPLLFFLTKQGRDEVAQMRKIEPKELEWKPAGSFNPAFLEHRLKTNDFRISVTLAAARCGFELKSWLDDQTLRRVHSQPSEKVTLTYPKDPQDPGGEVTERKVAVVPDGYFWLWTGEKNFHNFLEIDLRNVTGQYSDPGRKDWARKIQAYSQYYLSGVYQQRYPEAGNSMRVLTVTTSEDRLSTLKAVTETVVGKGKDSGLNRYWFTTFDKVAPTYEDFFNETVLTGKIWQVAGRNELYSLVW